MKEIQPISIWDKGETKIAVKFNTYAENVSLGNSAQFYYYMLSENNEMLASGKILMDGDDYQAWVNDDIVWDFIANKLNLIIVGDYVDAVV